MKLKQNIDGKLVSEQLFELLLLASLLFISCRLLLLLIYTVAGSLATLVLYC